MYQTVYYNKDESNITIFDDKKGKVEYSYKPYYWKLTDKESEYKTIFGSNVEKTFKYSTLNYEIDVSPILRTLIDLYTDSDEPAKNNIVFFDIETSSVGGFPKVEKGDKEIYSISFYHNKQYHIYLRYDTLLPFDLPKRLKEKNVIVREFMYEDSMLEEFCKFLNDNNVTILSSWNGDRFDIPYIVNRMKAINADYTLMSPIGVVKTGEGGFISLGCRVHLDYMELYKRFSVNDRESFKLDFIGEVELDLKKVEYDGDLDTLYKNDIERFIKYNCRDVQILVKLEKKLDYLNIAIALCHEAHVPYDWVFTPSRIIEGAIFTYLKRNKLVSINKPQLKDEGKIEGAYVKLPEPGLYNYLIDLDFTSLYPNTIRTLNISPEKKIGKIVNWDKYIQDFYKKENLDRELQFILYDLVNKKEKVFNITLDRFVQKLKKENWTISALGIVFKNDEAGFIPKIITDWFDKRSEFNKLKKQNKDNEEQKHRYHIKQYIKKIQMNTIYGYLAQPSSRFYDRDGAESVTISGQYLLKFSVNEVNKYLDNNESVIYGDTDSIFIHLDTVKEPIHELVNKLQKHVNNKLSEVCKNLLNVNDNKYLNLKQEIIAEKGLLLGKKRYALKVIDRDGIKPTKEDEIYEIKGIDSVKSSFPKSMKILVKDIIKDILNDKEKEDVDKKLYEFNELKDKVDVDDIGMNSGVKELEKFYDDKIGFIKGTPVHCKASLNYNKFLIKNKLDNKYKLIKSGDKVKYFYLKTNPEYFKEFALNNNDITNKEAHGFIKEYVDRDKIVKSALENKLKVFYDAMDWQLPDFTENVDTEYF